ncbi:MAG: hypothetical protein Q4P29_08080 [Tissierellia bacterium]|nr:hypothetical protein [Tissierellia bacterium]
MLLKISSQLKTELRHNLNSSLVANIIIIGIVYFIFGLKNLDIITQAMIIERFLPLMGIFTISTLFYSEQKSPIKDILIMKKTRLETIYAIRFIIRLLIYTSISIIYISILETKIDFKDLILINLHSISIGLIIGALGLLIFSFTNNISLAFLVSIGLILIQWFLPKDKSNILLLLTMPKISVNRIITILSLSLIFIVIGIKIWKRKKVY